MSSYEDRPTFRAIHGLTRITYDELANAAFISFSEVEHVRTVPIVSEGRIIAILSLSDAGELHGIELLNARLQLPQAIIDKLLSSASD